MSDTATGSVGRGWPIRLLVGVAVVALLGWGVIAAWQHLPRAPKDADEKIPPLPPDPREAADTPYRNVRPGVAYSGTAACEGCHADIAARYAKHPMGRSTRPAEGGPDEDLRAEARNPFSELGFEYRIEKKGGQTIHHEVRKDADGAVVYDFARPVSHVVGSSTRGRSYLWEREGRLFETPISWFSAGSHWGLSPGYAQRNHHFERPILPDCLFCHADRVEPIEQTVNRYEPPLFRGHAIGCERCHGPGELHVKRDARPAGEKIDPTIVNPTKLSPALRDAVCEQCHLQGEQRVARLGRSPFDYRPGLPLEEFFVPFVRAEHLMDYSRSVGQVEQMHVSKCYEKSGGELGCTSCHDPHEVPAPEKKAAFFRGRCQKCHEPGGKRDCAVPPPKREEAGNSCVRCHMPRSSSSNIVHASVTDHRVQRRPGAGPGREERPASPDDSPLHAFRGAPARRETGIALGRVAVTHELWPPARLAVPMLEEAVGKYPQDADALEGLVNAHRMLGESAEAGARLAQLLRHAPKSETALVLAARMSLPDKPAEALAYLERLVAVNPHASEYHLQTGLVFQVLKRWPASVRELDEAIRLNPARLEPRRAVIYSLVQEKEWERAEREVRAYAALAPPDLAAVRGWLKR